MSIAIGDAAGEFAEFHEVGRGPGASAVLTNILSQCRIDTATTTVSSQHLTARLPIQFKPGFAGPKGIWTAVATTNSAAVSPWQALGAWVLP